MPTDDGRRVLECIRYVRDLMGDVAKMFHSAESILEKAGWEHLEEDAFAFKSGKLDNWDQWVAREAYRFFVRVGGKPSATLSYIAVHLGDIDEGGEDYYALPGEPVVACGCFVTKPSTPLKEVKENAVYRWWGRSHLYAVRYAGATWDGKTKQVPIEKIFDEKERRDARFLLRHASLGLPLVRIAGPEELKKLAIDPFLALVEESERSG
jgi:hypothetical protein